MEENKSIQHPYFNESILRNYKIYSLVKASSFAVATIAVTGYTFATSADANTAMILAGASLLNTGFSMNEYRKYHAIGKKETGIQKIKKR